MVTLYFLASILAASGKEIPWYFIIKDKAFPPALHPKQWKICLSAFTEKEGVFSEWNGQRPKKFLPDFLRITDSDIISTISEVFRISEIFSSGIIIFDGAGSKFTNNYAEK